MKDLLAAPTALRDPKSALAIVGPTAIGKTAVALELVRLLGGEAEILSVDSVQVYRRLNIGSAKPSDEERANAAFHLIDLADPDEPFTLADYQSAAVQAQSAVSRRGNQLVLAGGTGLYFRSLTQPLGLPPIPPDEPYRAELLLAEQTRGAGTLHDTLRSLDPEAAARMHPNDTKRIIRALEVIRHSQRKITDLHRQDAQNTLPLISCRRAFALNCDRGLLYAQIERRVDKMMDAGFLHEVRALREQGFYPSLRAMQTLGYKELNAYLDGLCSYDEAVADIKQRTRQFARRQLIWFRADPRLTWIDAPPDRPASDVAQEIAFLCGIENAARVEPVESF